MFGVGPPGRSRLAGAVLAGVLTVALAGCGTPAEPEIGAALNSSGSTVGDASLPPTTSSSAPTSSSPASASAAASATVRPTETPRPVVRATTPRGSGVAWKPLGGDEFGGASLDSGAWSIYNSKGGFGNGLRRPEAVSLAGGILTITGRASDGVSGGISFHKGQLYGRWEFRARTDKGRGWSSAILLWPDSERWPADGELDIMEVPGDDRDRAHAFVHYSRTGSDDNTVSGSHVADFSQWHTFALEWLPDRVTWYVDGVKCWETTDRSVIPTTPMHPTIQLDMGPVKNWMPAPDDTTPDEVRLQVDYMRVSAAP